LVIFELFSFFKILTRNQNISSVSFGLFLTVHHVFDGFLLRKIAFGLLNPNRWNVLDISTQKFFLHKDLSNLNQTN
jgi:hypothetical protein